MKKFFVIQGVIILSAVIILIVGRLAIKDIGILYQGDVSGLSDIPAQISVYTKETAPLLSMETFLNSPAIQGTSNQPPISVALVTSNGYIKSYNRSASQTVKIDKVILGNENLVGKTLEFLSDDNTFVYDTADNMDFRIQSLQNHNVSKDEYPHYYQRNIQFYGSANLLKKDHQYLIFFFEYDVPYGGDSLYVMLSDGFFDLADTVNVPCTEGELSLYSNYYNNEVFAETQETIDAYNKMKKELFEHYGIET